MDQKFVDRQRAESKRAYHRDDEMPGLYLVIQPTGKRSWRYQRDLWQDGRRTKTVYEFLDGTRKLADARLWAQGLKLQVAMGIDPHAEPPMPDAAGPEAWTVKDALDKRLAWMEQNRKRNSVRDFRMSVKYLTALHAVPLGKLTKEQCREVHAAITKTGMTGKGASAPANKAMHHLGATWNHARKWDEARRLPVEPPTKGVFYNKTFKRAAKLSPDDLPAWAKAVASEPNEVRQAFHWICMLTGLRGETLCVVERAWVKDDRILIPRDDMKVDGGRADFVVPLSGQLKKWVATAIRAGDFLAPRTKFLFPSVTSASGHMEEWKLKGKQYVKDSRKMYRTQLEDLVPANIARSMTDHAAPGMDGHYVMSSHLFDARMAAQEAVSNRLLTLAKS